MSTILEALRKARAEVPREAVEARHEILSPHSHDYLATVPAAWSPPNDEVQTLRRLVYAAGAVILFLALVVFSLLLRRENSPAAAGSVAQSVYPRAAAPAAGALASAAARASVPQPGAIPAGRRVQVTVATPLVLPTEPPLPALTEVFPTPAGLVEESDQAFVARAAALRARVTAAPDPPRRARRSEWQTSSDASDPTSSLEISGIVWDKTSPVAMVNGKVVRPGSTIRGVRVARINKDSVVFEINGREVTMRQ